MILSTGTASLMVEGRQAANVAYSITPGGPRFALWPIAAVLGVEVRIGPLGDSHTLVFEDRHIIVGPAQASMVTVAPDGRGERKITPLDGAPIRVAGGLMVTLELLERALSDALNYQFAWNPDQQALTVARPELRRLRGSVSLVHQYQVSLVEIRFSEEPRYRVEQSPGALDIRLIGDRLELPIQIPRAGDPLVENIIVAPEGLRLELADNAVAEKPRLLTGPVTRMVIEVFEGRASSEAPGPSPRRVQERAPGIRTIALDPGHGGAETGAIGPAGSAEASLTLLVARALKLQLERRLPVKVVMTRTENVEVTHETRSAISNQNRADLFISLHFNSSFGPQAHGAETYFLSREASDQRAAEVAATENRAAGGETNPEQDLQMILWDLAQSYHLAESQRFANLVQEELNLALGLRDRGVKQAPFRVLMGAKMPAVLVELGFLSNPAEETKLQTPAYRAELVDALVRAVSRFKTQVEARDVVPSDADADSVGTGAAEDPS
ncbi:MAG: N-acetylmuramoyl-L-alanine amidase [bacterium]|nr:N-acetylmuramoyl-L-alanine amidase [bacterium]